MGINIDGQGSGVYNYWDTTPEYKPHLLILEVETNVYTSRTCLWAAGVNIIILYRPLAVKIHRSAGSLYKPQGSKHEKKVAAYGRAITALCIEHVVG